jgi:hypothetical protein
LTSEVKLFDFQQTCQAIEDSSRRLFYLLLCTQGTLNKPSHNLIANTNESPFAATAFALYRLLTHHLPPANQKQKRGEFVVKHCISARKPVSTVSAQISLHFSETSIPNAVLPRSLTTTFRAFNFTFS